LAIHLLVPKGITRLHRMVLPLVVGGLTFAFVWVGRAPPQTRTDFDSDYLWLAGHAVAHGRDPYAAIQEEIQRGKLHYPFYYPATAAVLMAPFGALSHHLGVTLFTAIGMGLLTWSVRGWRRWIVLSAPAFEAVLIGQWSPWLASGIGLPWLGAVWAAKPSIGLPLLAGWPSRRAVFGGLGVVVLSLVLVPHWPVIWFESLHATPHYRAPVVRVGGVLLLLAFLRWRKPEARMLGLLALIPHTTGLYEQLPLLLIPQTPLRFAGLMGLSWLAAGLVYTQETFVPSAAATLDGQWPYFLVLVYLPALAMVLLPGRQKEADDPAALEKVDSDPMAE
jgi:hypothetical protein